MREIKFRAFCKVEKTMNYFDFNNIWGYEGESCGVLLPGGGDLNNNSGYGRYPDEGHGINKDLEITQYTGLKDKNGKEIYEGDILKYTRTKWRCSGHPEDGKDLIHFCEVYWNDKHCGFWEQMWGAREKRVFSSGPLIFEDNRADENIIIVIGNIYENPELVGGSK